MSHSLAIKLMGIGLRKLSSGGNLKGVIALETYWKFLDIG